MSERVSEYLQYAPLVAAEAEVTELRRLLDSERELSAALRGQLARAEQAAAEVEAAARAVEVSFGIVCGEVK